MVVPKEVIAREDHDELFNELKRLLYSCNSSYTSHLMSLLIVDVCEI